MMLVSVSKPVLFGRFICKRDTKGLKIHTYSAFLVRYFITVLILSLWALLHFALLTRQVSLKITLENE